MGKFSNGGERKVCIVLLEVISDLHTKTTYLKEKEQLFREKD